MPDRHQRWVLVFIGACAVVGFIMGLRGAMPPGGPVDPDTTAPLSTPTEGVIIDAAPIPEEKPAEKTEEELAAEEEKAAREKAAAEKAAQEKAAAEAAEKAAATTPAPKEEAPPADPVGDLLEAVPPPETIIY